MTIQINCNIYQDKTIMLIYLILIYLCKYIYLYVRYVIINVPAKEKQYCGVGNVEDMFRNRNVLQTEHYIGNIH